MVAIAVSLFRFLAFLVLFCNGLKYDAHLHPMLVVQASVCKSRKEKGYSKNKTLKFRQD